jgi:DNA-directed RNA polymerase specialized sigma24 family protein
VQQRLPRAFELYAASLRRAGRTVTTSSQSGSEADDAVTAFEGLVNGSLRAGLCGPDLWAFAWSVVEPLCHATVRRRFWRAGRAHDTAAIADAVSATAEALARILGREALSREDFDVRLSLMLGIADHKAIDTLRRDRVRGAATALDPGVATTTSIEQAWDERARARRVQRARAMVFRAVNRLPELERRALVMVDVEHRPYDEVADALRIRATDIGNVLRRARRLRDRDLLGRDHTNDEVEAKALRLGVLRWALDVGAPVCVACIRRCGHLHGTEVMCPVELSPIARPIDLDAWRGPAAHA